MSDETSSPRPGGGGPHDPGPGWPPGGGAGGGRPAIAKVGAALGVVVVLAVGYFVFRWVFCRIEVPGGKVAVLVAKTGEDLDPGEVLGVEPGHKGIQLATLKPGRHFRNPLFWTWEIRNIYEVPAGSVGVLVRKYGETPDLEQNLLVPLATDGPHYKGIVREPLRPGLHEKVNPLAYDLELHPAVEIEAGFVGVQVNRVGDEPAEANTYLVGEDERGVVRKVLKPGLYYLNPYAQEVYAVDVRSQRLELSGGPEAPKDAQVLRFPSSDGFEIEVKLTVEWSIDEARAAEVFVRIGEGDAATLMENILHKALIPALRGNARLEGSKYPAANYISGESRTVFQESIFAVLSETCAKQGILIRSVLVNDIVPPQAIAAPIRAREVAKEELSRNEVQLEQAKAEQSLARETELVQQESARVEAETRERERVIAAENAQRVALIEQEKLLKVAQADVAAAELQAKAILARGEADADVITAQNTAEAKALERTVGAFASAGDFAAFTFARRLGPSVRTVFADPDGPFGALFRRLLEPGSPLATPDLDEDGAGGAQ